MGDAVAAAEKHIGDEPFAVLLGDSITRSKTPLTKQLIDVYAKKNKSTIAIREVPCERVNKHGIVECENVSDNIYKINGLVEKPEIENAPSNLAIVGRYILTHDIFDKINQTEPGFNGEIQLTDALAKLDEIYGVKFDGKVFNIENRLEWLKSSIDFAMYDDEFKNDLISYMKTFM